METAIIVAIIMAAASLIGSFFAYRKGAKKDEVDALRSIITELRTYIDGLERDKEDLECWAERLVCQIKEAGLVPAKFERKTRPTKPGVND